MEEVSQGFVLCNTKEYQWIVSTFQKWVAAKQETIVLIQMEAWSCSQSIKLCHVFCLFVMEERKINGEHLKSEDNL